jgi:hypothetical protein
MLTTKNTVVNSKAELFAMQNHEPGEMALCKDTNEIYIWDEDHGWSLFQVNGKGFEMNLYDLNKNVISQLNPLTPGEITMKMSLIRDYYNQANNIYHMLLCKDFSYYTIFNYDSMLSFPDFPSAICTIITELGEVYSIELLEDGAMEIWIKPTGEESPYAFYLFPYDAGVVYYG